MWQRFTSSSVHKVDAKGRVSVPALFRRVLEQSAVPGGLVVIPNLRGSECLEVFTHEFMDRLARNIARMKPFSKERRRLEYEFLANALPMQIDETGRIVLSPQLKAAAGIRDQARFVGLGDSFQIWAPDRFERMMADLREAEDADGADPLDAMPWDDAGDPFGGGA
ncbi:division/cell wall cluster transcriptional repressor MraZ [Oceanicella actignis]|uniref:Transcriptional regulator MraZ n=1 Tax=Oceanicella actignis TaxID=1189325 RepID=A0A1M7SB34_9RHOB|nr:division/cell wall cluster transcriptional repressor MraZ [Oceanicella actignis]TYO91523.1 MraZ protein [Oceanicella actignis]SET27861.1 MraZ protein [Oceanicella actignis]SHN55737.1 MraZ protein [Oceanicella actignis]